MQQRPQLQLHVIISVFLLILILFTTASNALMRGTQYLSLKTQFLVPQNAAREALRMRPLVWDPRLENYAKWYANKRRHDCALVHLNGPYGENIFWGSGVGWTPGQAAAAAWVSVLGLVP